MSTKVAEVSELVDIIVDYLHDDKPSLGACGAACRNWLAPSRYHLFFFVDLVDSPRAFLDLLDSPVTSIPPHVRALRIKYSTSTTSCVIPQLARHLLAVRYLHLESVCFSDLSIEARLACLSPESFKQVTRLTLDHVIFDSMDQLAELTCSYPLLEHLFLSRVSWEQVSSSKSYEWRFPASLRVLELSHISNQHTFLETLFDHRIHRIETVRLSMIPRAAIHSTVSFLRNIGAHLHHLRFCPLYDSDWVQYFSLCDLGHNTQLRSLEINYIYVYTAQRASSMLPTFLSRICSPLIRCVGLWFHIRTPEELDMIDWPALAQAFAESTFDGLQKLEIWLSEPDSHGESVRVIERRLSALYGRGVLEIYHFDGMTSGHT